MALLSLEKFSVGTGVLAVRRKMENGQLGSVIEVLFLEEKSRMELKEIKDTVY